MVAIFDFAPSLTVFDKKVIWDYETSPDRDHPTCRLCPILKEQFNPSVEAVLDKMGKAARALAVQRWVFETAPEECPTCPLNIPERSRCAMSSALGFIMASYAKNFAKDNWYLRPTPLLFGTFAGGMLAMYQYRFLHRRDPSLPRRFPPSKIRLPLGWTYECLVGIPQVPTGIAYPRLFPPYAP